MFFFMNSQFLLRCSLVSSVADKISNRFGFVSEIVRKIPETDDRKLLELLVLCPWVVWRLEPFVRGFRRRIDAQTSKDEQYRKYFTSCANKHRFCMVA